MKSIENNLAVMEGENQEAFLLRVGQAKDLEELNMSWRDIADFCNINFGESKDESTYRKTYKKLVSEKAIAEHAPINEGVETRFKEFYREIEKTRIRQQDERMAYRRQLRAAARGEMLAELFENSIKRTVPLKEHADKPKKDNNKKAIYALLGDIHFGISFKTPIGEYNPDIARARVLHYADQIIAYSYTEGINICYVSLLGDLISGNIHSNIRIENRENTVDQVVDVSELIGAFLSRLGDNFDEVHVNSVDGNHSRLTLLAEDAPRDEKLDKLVGWYCKSKLEKYNNVVFEDNYIDSTIASYIIFGKLYLAVHGDMDNNLMRNVDNIQRAMYQHVDCIVAGHTHVADTRYERIMIIHNGSVCGSGDEYTMKKRLFAPPVQSFLIVDENGVQGIRYVNLENVK